MDILIVIVIAAVVLGIIVIILSRRQRKLNPADVEYIRETWAKILGMDAVHAIIEADKLLDFVLGKKGYTGPLGQKLKKAQSLFKHPNDLWHAHKKRNYLAHELHAKISPDESRNVLIMFKKGFHDLGIDL